MAFLDEFFRHITEAKKKDDDDIDDFVPGWDEEECREGADDSNVRPEDYMDDKYERCHETTMSGDIATVPMGFKGLKKGERTPVESVHEAAYSPKTGEKCSCKPGIERDNCPSCEGSGWKLDFAKIHQHYDKQKKNQRTPPVEAVKKIVGSLLGEDETGAWSHLECPNCGAKVTGDTCPRCGEPIDESVQEDEYNKAPTGVDPDAARKTQRCLNCYENPREPGSELCADCEDLLAAKGKRESVRESVDESVFGQLVHYKESIPHLIGVIESIVSSNTPADSDELYDELAEVVTHLAKADHMLAVLVTSKNLRTPRADPEDEKKPEPEPEKQEPEEEMPHAGAPMDRPDETEDERYHAPRH
jgi:hypothetical protein